MKYIQTLVVYRNKGNAMPRFGITAVCSNLQICNKKNKTLIQTIKTTKMYLIYTMDITVISSVDDDILETKKSPFK
jgi:hypothetical protein